MISVEQLVMLQHFNVMCFCYCRLTTLVRLKYHNNNKDTAYDYLTPRLWTSRLLDWNNRSLTAGGSAKEHSNLNEDTLKEEHVQCWCKKGTKAKCKECNEEEEGQQLASSNVEDERHPEPAALDKSWKSFEDWEMTDEGTISNFQIHRGYFFRATVTEIKSVCDNKTCNT